MFLTNGLCHDGNRFATSGVIIRRQYLSWCVLTPKLTGDDIHLTLHANKLLLGIHKNLIRIHAGVQNQLELLSKPFSTKSPFSVGPKSATIFKKHLVFIQRCDGRSTHSTQLIELRRFSNELKNPLLVKPDGASVLQDRRLQNTGRRVAQRFSSGLNDARNLGDPTDRILQVRFFGQR